VPSGMYKTAAPGPFADTPAPIGPVHARQSPYSLPAAPAAPAENGLKYVIAGLTVVCAVMAVGLVYLGLRVMKLGNPVAP